MFEEYFENEFKDFVQKTIELWHVPGFAVAIVKNGETLFCEGFGKRNIEKDLPVNSKTLFPIASCTKAFTAFSVAMQVEAGKLDWDKPVRDYLPSFMVHDSFASERITPRDLLTHRTGLPRHDLIWYGSKFGREEILRRLKYLEPSRDLRYQFQYNNIMYMVAGYLVGKLSGTSWEKFVQSNIFDKLGMVESNFSTEVAKKTPNHGTPYLYRDNKLRKIPFFEADGENDNVGPCGNIISCVDDMAKWLKINLNGGKTEDGEQLISEGNLEQLHTPQIFMDDPQARKRFGYEFTSYGLGWGMRSHKGEVLVQHGGALDGFASYTSILPRHNIGVVALSNADAYYNPVPNIVCYTIYDKLLNLDPTDWNSLIKPNFDELVEAEKRSQEQSVTQRKAKGKTSHPIEAYLGDYESPAYGIVSIRNIEDKLEVVFNDHLSLSLEHYHFDIFEACLEKFDIYFKLSFFTDMKGNISQVAIQVEPMVNDIIFVRLPDTKMMENAFLLKFVGVYDFQKTLLTISLKDEGVLTAFLQGQPEYELIPYQGTEFNLKGLSGFSLKFEFDENEKVTEAIVTQPGMVFRALKQG
jgi:CubicO group peptidase (beta-lactamase class C family)